MAPALVVMSSFGPAHADEGSRHEMRVSSSGAQLLLKVNSLEEKSTRRKSSPG